MNIQFPVLLAKNFTTVRRWAGIVVTVRSCIGAEQSSGVVQIRNQDLVKRIENTCVWSGRRNHSCGFDNPLALRKMMNLAEQWYRDVVLVGR